MFPQGYLTLEDASRKYGVPVRTLRSWIQKGWLEKFQFPLSFYAFIKEDELVKLIAVRRGDPEEND